MTLHATLGASSAYRWFDCPGSIKLSKGLPNESSVYAREGSCAHGLAEKCLTNNWDAIDHMDEEIEGYEDLEITEEMCSAVQEYLDTVRDDIAEYVASGCSDWELGIEVKFDLSYVYAGMFGTCDAVLYLPAWKKLIVYDYKHGYIGVVVAHNKQTMYYAVGALTGKHNRAIDGVELVIVQPRSNDRAIIKRWSCDTLELADFIADLKIAAKATEAADAPLKAGPWCKFCPAAANLKCRVLDKFVEEKAMAEFDTDDRILPKAPEKMSKEQLQLAWDNAAIIESWVKNVKSYAHEQAIAGNVLPGCKFVEGRSRRKWIDEDQAESHLEGMQAMGDLEGNITITKLKSPAQIDAMLGKKHKAAIEELWVKGPAGLSLVPITDDRPAAKANAESEFS